MARKLISGFIGAIFKSGNTDSSYDARQKTHFHWRCECGAHSRGGWLFKSDAEYAAQRHQWREGVGHPMPEIYSTDGMG